MSGPTGQRAGGGEGERTEISAPTQSSAGAGEGLLLAAPSASQVGRRILSQAAVIALQRSAGNRAVAATLQRQPQPPVSSPPAPPSASDLNAKFQQQLSSAPPDYDAAALTLNGFNDTDIDALVSSVSPAHREGLFVGALRTMLLWPPPHRVTNAIQRIDPAAARSGRISYIREAAAKSEWRQVALALNGFSDADIDDVVENVLPASSLAAIRTAAQTHMPGWSDRVVRGLNRIIVANQMTTMADPAAPTRAVWKPSGNDPSRTDFSAWAMAPPPGPGPFTLDPKTVINCWEMVLYAAYKSGTITWTWIHDVYTYPGPNDWYDELANRIARGSRTWDRATKLPRPRRGDIVMFDGASHVALATGVVDAAGTHIQSFWPPPDVSFIAAGTPDRVKDITIESLLPVCDSLARRDGRAACVVTVGAPAW